MSLKEQHLWGAGAAACAVCCTAPLLTLLGIGLAGTAATVATFAFAGAMFACSCCRDTRCRVDPTNASSCRPGGRSRTRGPGTHPLAVPMVIASQPAQPQLWSHHMKASLPTLLHQG